MREHVTLLHWLGEERDSNVIDGDSFSSRRRETNDNLKLDGSLSFSEKPKMIEVSEVFVDIALMRSMM